MFFDEFFDAYLAGSVYGRHIANHPPRSGVRGLRDDHNVQEPRKCLSLATKALSGADMFHQPSYKKCGITITSTRRHSGRLPLFHDSEKISFGVANPHQPEVVSGHSGDDVGLLVDGDIFRLQRR
jgi:hypothetical protein